MVNQGLLVLFLFPKSREYLIDYNFVCPRISFGSFTFTSLVLQATCSSTRAKTKIPIFLLIFKFRYQIKITHSKS
jgi:hypothetical protein